MLRIRWPKRRGLKAEPTSGGRAEVTPQRSPPPELHPIQPEETTIQMSLAVSGIPGNIQFEIPRTEPVLEESLNELLDEISQTLPQSAPHSLDAVKQQRDLSDLLVKIMQVDYEVFVNLNTIPVSWRHLGRHQVLTNLRPVAERPGSSVRHALSLTLQPQNASFWHQMRK